MKVSKEFLRHELDLPYAALESKIVDQDRWSTYREIIFKWGDKFYQTEYRRGSTEYQDDIDFWEEDEVEIQEVHKVQTLVEVWEPVCQSTKCT